MRGFEPIEGRFKPIERLPPHPTPLPNGEREPTEFAALTWFATARIGSASCHSAVADFWPGRAPSARRCARRAGVGAEISVRRADPADRAVRGRRPGRHPGAHHRRSAGEAARPEHRDREPRRRRRQCRHRGGGAGAARRLHAAARARRRWWSIRCSTRACRSIPYKDFVPISLLGTSPTLMLAKHDVAKDDARVHRQGQGRAGQAQLFDARHRHQGALRGRAAQGCAPGSTSCTCRIRAAGR